MADITITAANVSLVSAPSGVVLEGQTAAAAIGVGQAVYLLDNGTWGLAQCDGTAVEAGSNDLGIALNTHCRIRPAIGRRSWRCSGRLWSRPHRRAVLHRRRHSRRGEAIG